MLDNMNGLDAEPSSLEHVKRSDVFPKKMLVSDDSNLRVPFPLLSGESAEFLGRTSDAIVVLTNFRLLIRYKDSFINVPLGLIEAVEIRDIFYLHIYNKDATVVRCTFSTNESCQDWFKRLSQKTAPKNKNEDVFAFCFHAWCVDQSPSSDQVVEGCYQLCPTDKACPYSFTKELVRMNFDLVRAWRYTEINKTFGLCGSYPTEHIVPKSVSDDNLRKVAGFRALQRFPSTVWRNIRNGAVLLRSSQPEMGFFGWRNTDDENLLSAIPLACALNPGTQNRPPEDVSGSNSSSEESSIVENGIDGVVEPKKMLIIDCRSYGAAFANRAKGGGVECPEYYQSCEIQFMNLANIHSIRKSFLALRLLCSSGVDQACWLSGLENTKWLHNLASLLKAATLVVNVNEKEGRPVLVHCSDGWDRTSQIISLAELMLDPYYRTVQGFQVLVEREWLYFGHKFADRCGNGVHSEDMNERCPVFLQWLECVYQLIFQFPCQFQFNEAFLVKLVQHTYSCLFGTFLCNTVQERIQQQLGQHTASVWSLLSDPKFHNHLYAPSMEHEVLYPATHVQSLRLWVSIYLSNNSSFAGPEDMNTQTLVPPAPDSSEPSNLQKTRSCENIHLNELNSSLSRRKSDPNIAMDHCEQQTQKLLKDAMAGENSCSSESVKSSENNTSFSENGEITTVQVNGLDHSDADVSEIGHVENGVAEEEKSDSLENPESEKSVAVEDEGMVESNGNHVTNGNVCDHGDEEEVHVYQNGVINGSVERVEEHLKTEDVETKVVKVEESSLKSVGHEMNSMSNGTVNGDADVSIEDDENSENSVETLSETEDSQSEDSVANGTCEIPNGAGPSMCNSSLYGPGPNTINGANSNIRLKNIIPKLTSDLHVHSLESSTDTVTEDVLNSESNQTLTPSPNNGTVYKVASLQSLCDKASSLHGLQTVEQRSSISTSTSDLTDSRVGNTNVINNVPRDALLNYGDSLHTSLKLRCILSHTGLCSDMNGTTKGVSVDTSITPPYYPTPISPQSRNSTCPPTPGTSDGKSIDMPRHQGGISRQLDADGLTKFSDPVQQQIENIKSRYEQKIAMMEDQITQLRCLVQQHASACNGDGVCYPDAKFGNDSPGSCDLQSIQSNYSNAASDASWDQMDDPEVNVTRWVPDHMVTQCACCDTEFTMLRRKHHCRNCGLIFCHNCCKDTVPLPHQMIHTQERVCQDCYNKVTAFLSKSVIEIENGIGEHNTLAAAASN